MPQKTVTAGSVSVSNLESLGCDLCQDEDGKPQAIFIHGRCHMSAPSWVSIEDGHLVVRCYVPDCQREIARFEIVEAHVS